MFFIFIFGFFSRNYYDKWEGVHKHNIVILWDQSKLCTKAQYGPSPILPHCTTTAKFRNRVFQCWKATCRFQEIKSAVLAGDCTLVRLRSSGAHHSNPTSTLPRLDLRSARVQISVLPLQFRIRVSMASRDNIDDVIF